MKKAFATISKWVAAHGSKILLGAGIGGLLVATQIAAPVEVQKETKLQSASDVVSSPKTPWKMVCLFLDSALAGLVGFKTQTSSFSKVCLAIITGCAILITLKVCGIF